ncbi:MAG TPA: hypothetical protein VFS62_05530 [Chloroflexota bacterium]|jgi:hypothetical protein|nr:hypothetical protein [Chloroflexota bacterium]
MLSDIELLAGLGLWHELEHTPRTSHGPWLAPLRRAIAAVFRIQRKPQDKPDILPNLWPDDDEDWRIAA